MLVFIYVFLVWCTSCSEAVIKLPPNVTVPALIVFGDSIGDQGCNNNLPTMAKCNFPPYGKDFVGGLATGRFSNSRTPPDMLASEFEIKDLVPAYLDSNLQIKDLSTGISFASGGAGYDPQTSALALVVSLSDQLKLFKEYIGKLKASLGAETTNYILSNALYLIVAGSDDFVNTYFAAGTRRLHYDVSSYADLVVGLASNFIKEIYELGARRMAVFGVPPLGCLPSQRTLGGGLHRVCAEDRNEAAKLYNAKLSSKLDSLDSSLPQARVVYIDIYNPLLDIIQNPTKYGIDVVDRGCCGTGVIEVVILCSSLTPTCPDRSKYLFWDSYHPTEYGYKILVDQLVKENIDKFFN